MQLNKKEGEYIRALSCINKNIAGRTQKEYIEDNKDKIKDYYQNNKELINEKARERYEDNKEKVNERRKDYYKKNKELINEKHREYRENNKEKQREYYENNKEKISEYGKEYREKNKEKITYLGLDSWNDGVRLENGEAGRSGHRS